MIKPKDQARMTRRRKLLVAVVVFIVLVLLVSSIFGKRGLLGLYQARRSLAVLQDEIRTLEERKAQLEREIEALKEDPLAVDAEAREKLWLMPPDEVVIIKRGKDGKSGRDIKN